MTRTHASCDMSQEKVKPFFHPESSPCRGRFCSEETAEIPFPNLRPYKLDSSLSMKSRVPGSDDGPALSFSDPSWADPCVFEEHDRSQTVIEFPEKRSPYLDSYTHTRGVDENDDGEEGIDPEKVIDPWQLYKSEINRKYACGSTAVILTTEDYDDYLHTIRCQKHFCPVCGGKGGYIHKRHKKSVRNRVNINNYNFRCFVFTVPEEYRLMFKSRYGINQLFSATNRLIKKYFGKRKGAIATVHLYGDQDPSKYHPHINVLVPEKIGLTLKIDRDQLLKVRESWARALRGMGCTGLDQVDIFYSFKTKMAAKGHIIKYMVRPTWDAETLNLVDDNEKLFLVLSLKGFRYLRYWGELADCNYKDSEMNNIIEAIEETKAAINKPVSYRGIVKVNIADMMARGQVEYVADGIYKIKKHPSMKGGSNAAKHGV